MAGNPDPVSGVTTTGALGGGDLAAVAEIVADRARLLAGWSVKIPPSITVKVSGNTATIEAPVEPGYAAELRVRHPLFGNRSYWYGPPGHPFLRPALEESMDAAIRRYAQKIDKMARAAGFR